MNLYAYVGNNPATWTDPSGLLIDGGVVSVPAAYWVGGLIVGAGTAIATDPAAREAAVDAFEHLIEAGKRFPENAANVYGRLKDFFAPDPVMMDEVDDGEDASSVTPTDDEDDICEVNPGPGTDPQKKDPKFPKKGPGGDEILEQIKDELEKSKKIPWGSWQDYPKVTINGQEYAKVGERLYSRHAIDRMQPSGMRYSGRAEVNPSSQMPYVKMHQIRQTGGNYDYGRSVAPQYIEDVIASTTGVEQPNMNLSHMSGSLEVILNPQGAVVTVITH